MKTKNVKFNKTYLLDEKDIVTVVAKVPGKIKNRNMHLGILFNGYSREQSKFLLSNKQIVKAERLKQINN